MNRNSHLLRKEHATGEEQTPRYDPARLRMPIPTKDFMVVTSSPFGAVSVDTIRETTKQVFKGVNWSGGNLTYNLDPGCSDLLRTYQ